MNLPSRFLRKCTLLLENRRFSYTHCSSGPLTFIDIPCKNLSPFDDSEMICLLLLSLYSPGAISSSLIESFQGARSSEHFPHTLTCSLDYP